ncbi:MAG: hypothetical protein WBG50_24620 [Desulfomonilaceae bacterium]
MKREAVFIATMGVLRPAIRKVFKDKGGAIWMAMDRQGKPSNILLDSQLFEDIVTTASMLPEPHVPCSSAVVKDIRRALRVLAQGDHEPVQLYTRFGSVNGTILFDLVDADRTTIQIDEHGWGPTSRNMCHFIRTEDQGSLPFPDRGGDFTAINRFLPLSDEADRIIIQTFLPTVLFDQFERPFLVVHGPRWSGKTTTTRIWRNLINPMKTDSYDVPNTKRDLVVILSGDPFPLFDNVNESFSLGLQSILSGAATGYGHKERQFFTNFGSATVQFRRTMIINGLRVPVTAEDIISRCLLVPFDGVFLSGEADKSSLESEFDKQWASLFGGMLDVVSAALKIMPTVAPIPPGMFRFRDWARAALACAEVMGISRHDFLEVLDVVKKRQDRYVTTSTSVCDAALRLMQQRSVWEGTATELLGELEGIARKARLDMARWPKCAEQLGHVLNNVKRELETEGVSVERNRVGKYRDRLIRLTKVPVTRPSAQPRSLKLSEK